MPEQVQKCVTHCISFKICTFHSVFGSVLHQMRSAKIRFSEREGRIPGERNHRQTVQERRQRQSDRSGGQVQVNEEHRSVRECLRHARMLQEGARCLVLHLFWATNKVQHHYPEKPTETRNALRIFSLHYSLSSTVLKKSLLINYVQNMHSVESDDDGTVWQLYQLYACDELLTSLIYKWYFV